MKRTPPTDETEKNLSTAQTPSVDNLSATAPSSTATVGVVCGLKTEAACLNDLSDWAVTTVSGASPVRARINAEILLAKGAKGLISFGVSGALSDKLQPGDIILGTNVLQAKRAPQKSTSPWADLARKIAKDVDIRLIDAAVFGSDTIVTTAAQKQALAAEYHADAVDMESHAVASVATDAGKPFIILRTIADSHDHAIPGAALKGVGPDGGIRPLSVAASLFTRPQDLAGVVKLGQDNAAAMASLRSVAQQILPAFRAQIGKI